MKSAQALVALAVIGGLAVSSLPAGAQPTDQKVVYTRSTGETDVWEETEVFLMDEDGSNVVRLTNNHKEDGYATLSPDGERIAFSRRTGDQYDLFVMDSDGQNVRRLIRSGNADEVLPTWAPDGKKLAYTATTATPDGWQSDIYRIRVRDGRFRRLTFTPVVKEFSPEWAPDGSQIAFTKQNEKAHRYGIATVHPDASGLDWVVINPLSTSGYADVNPTWSPDSQWIAFSRDHGGDPYVDIYKVMRDGSEVTAVTELNELAETPVWGDDDRILFMHDEGIAVVHADGGEIQHITPTRTGLPYWWPDW